MVFWGRGTALLATCFTWRIVTASHIQPEGNDISSVPIPPWTGCPIPVCIECPAGSTDVLTTTGTSTCPDCACVPTQAKPPPHGASPVPTPHVFGWTTNGKHGVHDHHAAPNYRPGKPLATEAFVGRRVGSAQRHDDWATPAVHLNADPWLVPLGGQCGGMTYFGPTECASVAGVLVKCVFLTPCV
ncbi:hypothetical protein H1R20_g3677, partial [Candolleomyces eurysporus]